MAGNRNISTRIWNDERFRMLSDDGKVLFIYTITSPHSNIAGTYVLPKGYISEDLGWPMRRVEETVSELFRNCSETVPERLAEDSGSVPEQPEPLVYHDEGTRIIHIPKFLKYDPLRNPNQVKAALTVVAELPECALKYRAYSAILRYTRAEDEQFRNCLETVSERFRNKPETYLPKTLDLLPPTYRPETPDLHPLSGKPDDPGVEKIPFAEILAHLNAKTGKSFRATRKDTQAHIRARWGEGYRLEDFKRVVDDRVARWRGDPKWAEYLRPSTLFGPKFEAYLNAGEADGRRNERGDGTGRGAVQKPGKYAHLGVRVNVDTPPRQDTGVPPQGGGAEAVPAGPKG